MAVGHLRLGLGVFRPGSSPPGSGAIGTVTHQPVFPETSRGQGGRDLPLEG
jgi:hypothetical protein